MDKQEKNILVGTLILVILYCLVKKRYYDIFLLLGSFILSYLLSKNIFYSLFATVLIYVIYFNSSSNNIMEGMTDKKKKHKSKKEKAKKKPVKKNKESVPEEEQEEESHIDIGSTFMKAYKNLSPEAIDGLGKDTKDLIGTQQKLMSTLNTLGPTLKEGKKVLDTFKNYFDDSDLVKM